MQQPLINLEYQYARPNLLPLSLSLQHPRINERSSLRSFQENDDVLPIVQEPLFSQCDRLARILRSRPIDQPHIKIIAVDGSDPDLVKFMMRFLHCEITTRVGNMVRILHDDWVRARMPDIKDLATYRQYISLWASLWEYVFQSPVKSIPGPVIETGFGGHQQTYLSCVNIIPFSPLHVSQRAANSIPIVDAYSDDEHWHWLAGMWRGQIKPNMIILIGDYNKTHSRSDVMKIERQNMSLFLIATSKCNQSEILTVTEQQLRRISFEVIESLRQD